MTTPRQWFYANRYELGLVRLLLIPSFLSTSVSLIIALGIFAAKLLQTGNNKSSIERSISAFSNISWVQNATQAFHTVIAYIDNAQFTGTLTLALFWSCVGLLVYALLLRAKTAVGEAHALQSELHYANQNRKAFVMSFLERLGLRLVTLIVLLGSIRYILKNVSPKVNKTFTEVVHNNLSFEAVGKWFLAILIIIAVLHVLVVLIRLLFLRVRLFSQTVYA